MRAAVDVTPLLGPRTGIGELVAGLVEALRERGDVEIVPVALTWRGRGEAGATHLPIPARLVQRLWANTELLPITTWVRGIDVVHGTNYVVGPRAGSRHNPRNPRIPRIPRIVTVHDLAIVKTPELCAPATRVFPTLVKRAVATGAMVQTDSESTAEEVRDWLGIDPSRVRAVLPGFNPLVAPAPEGLEGQLGNSRFLLTIGTEEPRKGLLNMVAVLAELYRYDPELRWVHAGSSGWGSDELTRAIGALPQALRAMFVRLGRVTPAQKAWLLTQAAAFAYPSLDEGFGYPPLEAMSLGTPVLCADLAVLREVGGPAASYVNVSDPDAFAAALIEVLDPSQRADEHHRALRRAQAERFRWSDSAAAQVRWYSDAIAASR
jgi:glycosyltransferase involved in cell wall biosynthesis